MKSTNFVAPALAVAWLIGSACTENKTPVEPAALNSPTPTPTLTPAQVPLAAVRVTLAPASSSYRHAVLVHIEVRETRGIGFFASYAGMSAPGTSYSFPDRESGLTEIRVEAGGAGTTDVLVEDTEDVPCSAGLVVEVQIRSDDRLVARVPATFNCSSPFWPF